MFQGVCSLLNEVIQVQNPKVAKPSKTSERPGHVTDNAITVTMLWEVLHMNINAPANLCCNAL